MNTANAHWYPTTRRAAITLFGTLALAVLLPACERADRTVAPTEVAPGAPLFTVGSGTSSTLLGRGTFAEAFKVKRKTGAWEVEVEAKPNLDIAVQSITFAPGGHSGWHGHPGPVFIQVKSGTMTFYESHDPTCTPIVRTAGQGYLDTGDHAHIARNETSQPAENIVVYFAPQGAAVRIDKPVPGNCPF
jgi:hypothetical protein